MLMAGDAGPTAITERYECPVIIGAGPAGLSVGYALARAGIPGKILEKGSNIGSAWHTYYDTLRLNSPRVLSSLPGMTIDRGAGRFPSRVDFLLYLERYARRWDLDVDFGVNVTRVERCAAGGWLIIATRGTIWAPQVILATGLYAEPEIPQWPGLESFEKPLVHTRSFRNAESYAGKKVLVVGAGQSAADIAMESAATGAHKVWMSTRTPPHVAPPDVFGVSPSSFAFIIKLFGRAAEPTVDFITNQMQRIIRLRYYGDISEFGFGIPKVGLATSMRTTGRGILIDRGLVTALRSGQIQAVSAVVSLHGDQVALADGNRVQPDVVVCGTGARSNLDKLVGHLGVLGEDGRPRHFGGADTPGAPGMYFMGYRLPPGVLPDARRDAPAIARSITGDRRFGFRFPALIWKSSRAGYKRPWRPAKPESSLAASSVTRGHVGSVQK